MQHPEQEGIVDFSTLLVERDGSVEGLTLNRPDRLNAIDSRMASELTAYFRALPARPDVRLVVMRGAGRAFCAGVDIKEAFNDSADRRWGEAGPVRELAIQQGNRDFIVAMRACPQPVISLLQGSVCGAGFGLALASDLRVASRSARMNCAFVQIGLGGCDIGVSYFLPRLAGASIAAELILTGSFIDADRAAGLGLVNRVAESDAELAATAQPLIDAMLALSPLALRLSKDALRHAIDAGSLEATIAMEDRNQVLCARSADYHEAVRAFQEKRRPEWHDA